MTDQNSQNESERITLKEAITLTGKSESTMRRLMRAGELQAQKNRDGGVYKITFDRRELLAVMAEKFSRPSPQAGEVKERRQGSQTGQDRSVMTAKETDRKGMNERILTEHIRLLEDTIARERRTVERLESENRELRERIERLHEEIKALLRDNSPERKRRGIVGYLVERIAR